MQHRGGVSCLLNIDALEVSGERCNLRLSLESNVQQVACRLPLSMREVVVLQARCKKGTKGPPQFADGSHQMPDSMMFESTA